MTARKSIAILFAALLCLSALPAHAAEAQPFLASVIEISTEGVLLCQPYPSEFDPSTVIEDMNIPLQDPIRIHTGIDGAFEPLSLIWVMPKLDGVTAKNAPSSIEADVTAVDTLIGMLERVDSVLENRPNLVIAKIAWPDSSTFTRVRLPDGTTAELSMDGQAFRFIPQAIAGKNITYEFQAASFELLSFFNGNTVAIDESSLTVTGTPITNQPDTPITTKVFMLDEDTIMSYGTPAVGHGVDVAYDPDTMQAYALILSNG